MAGETLPAGVFAYFERDYGAIGKRRNCDLDGRWNSGAAAASLFGLLGAHRAETCNQSQPQPQFNDRENS